jgi:hypothetical protein
MSIDKRFADGSRRVTRGPGWTGSDSRDEGRAAVDGPAAPRPVVDSRGRAIITPNGYPLYF